MKAERRHELKENDLAHALGELRTYIQTHGQRLMLTIGGIVLVCILVWFLVNSRSQSIARDWQRFSEIITDADTTGWTEALQSMIDLAQDTRDPALAMNALGNCGKEALSRALEGKDEAEIRQYTDLAERAFTKLNEKYGRTHALARGVALCGLATVAENRFALTGDASQKDVARELLEQVTNDPELNATPMKSQALSRLGTLDEVFQPVTFAPPAPPPPATDESAKPPAADAPAGSAPPPSGPEGGTPPSPPSAADSKPDPPQETPPPKP